MKKYVLIAGVNGAGKSTLYRAIDSIQELPRINTDEIVKEFGRWDNDQDMFKASKIAVKKIKEYFNSNTSFNQETTLCGKSILNNIDKAKSLGYYVELHYISIDNVDIALDRIARRVKAGGHGVPEKDVRRRFKESLVSLKSVLPKCNQVILYDNTVEFNRFAIYENGHIARISSDIPNWYKKLKIESLIKSPSTVLPQPPQMVETVLLLSVITIYQFEQTTAPHFVAQIESFLSQKLSIHL